MSEPRDELRERINARRSVGTDEFARAWNAALDDVIRLIATVSEPRDGLREAVRAALTNEDEIAHGEAVVERNGEYVGLGKCAYDDDPWPCRTQRGIDRLLARLREVNR